LVVVPAIAPVVPTVVPVVSPVLPTVAPVVPVGDADAEIGPVVPGEALAAFGRRHGLGHGHHHLGHGIANGGEALGYARRCSASLRIDGGLARPLGATRGEQARHA